jgi:membrane dipeptidase
VRRALELGLAAIFGAVTTSASATGPSLDEGPVGVVDLHVDLPYRLNYKQAELAKGSGEFVAEHLVSSGVVGVVLPLYVPRNVSPTGPRMKDLEASYQRLIGALPKTAPYAAPGCVGEAGKVRTWLSFEGAGPLAAEPEVVDGWVKRGVRLFGLVHSFDNELATSSGSPGPHRAGLTEAGREVTRRVFAAGALLDVSHASDRAASEVLDIADEVGGTVVASHSNARAVAKHPRNLTDELIGRIARTGGVIGVNFHSRFVVDEGRASLADVVRQVTYLLAKAGADHVAIGSDYEGGINPPPELADVRGFPALRDALVQAGLSREIVAQIFHGNALRVLCGPAKPPRAP